MPCQDRVHGPAKVSNALAVNDSDAKYPAFETCLEVIRDEILDFLRPERVEVQHAIDRQIDGGRSVVGWNPGREAHVSVEIRIDGDGAA